MKKNFIFVLLLPFLIWFINACNSDGNISETPSTWKTGKKPNTSNEWHQASWSNSIFVILENDSVTATTDFEKKQNPTSYYIIPDKKSCRCSSCNGTMIGWGHGEWGGGIIFIPIETDVFPEYRVMSENFFSFYRIGDRIFALTGLAHLGSSRGSIYELVVVGETFEDRWEAVKILDIQYAPETFLLVNEDLYIATSNTLIIVKNGEISDILIENAGWGTLYPDSMVYANNSIFVGMRGWICEYDLDTRTEKWYDFLDECGTITPPG